MNVKEVAEVMEKKTTRNWTPEETNLFCSILTDPVAKFILTLEQKALKKQYIIHWIGPCSAFLCNL